MDEFKRLFPHVKTHIVPLTFSLLLLVAAGGFEVLTTSLAKPLFDDVLTPLPATATSAVTKFDFLRTLLDFLPGNSVVQLSLALLVFTLFKGATLYYSNVLMGVVGQSVVMTLRNRLFEHMLGQSMGFFAIKSTGSLMSRMSSDVEQLQEAVSTNIGEFFREAVLLLFLVLWVFYIDWRMATLAMMIVPAAILLTATMGRRIRRLSWQGRERTASLSDRLQQTLTGMRIVKAFGMEPHEVMRFRKETRELFAANLRAAKVLFLNAPAMEFLGVLCFVPLLFYAHARIASGTLSLGLFSVSLFSLFRMYDPIRKLSRIHVQFQKSMASAARILELLDTRIEIQDSPQAAALKGMRRSISFENVGFDYSDASGQSRVLKNINLMVPRGRVVALVGSSGAGKSTLVSLIPRFYDISEGRITIDGMDLRSVTQESLRKNIAIVTQETFLFNDTVWNNIAYGNPAASPEEIRAAAESALAHDFITQLPAGYKTIIGERGQRLSGGERQRLSIARALLKNAPILILDEATSALDSESEKMVQQALANLMRDRTTFIVAHRISSVRRADMIVVMENGRIQEFGTHETLMENGGIYRRLFTLQSGEVSSVGR